MEYVVIAIVVAVVGLLTWRRLGDKPSGSGSIRPKPVPPMPVAIAWKVMRGKRWPVEQSGKWYIIADYPTKPPADEMARGLREQSWAKDIPIEVHPVYADEKG